MCRVIARAFSLIVVFTVGACETVPTRDTSPEETAVEARTYTPTPGLTPKQRLSRSLEYLEEGDAERARAEIIAYLERVPRSSVAQGLLLQIDTAPDIYYPTDYQEVILRPGQSLSNVAKVYLGSAYEFYALARYNDIGRPKRVVPGQVVKVPLTPQALEAFEREIGGGEEPEVDDSSALEELADDTSVEDELQGIEDVPDTEEGMPAAEVVGESTVDAVTDEHEAASPGMDSDAGAIADGTMDPMTAPAEIAEQMEPDVPAIDVDSLHRQAINAYRSQDLDRAIGLWDQILAVDPTHDSARLYRSQAEALKERLQRLR